MIQNFQISELGPFKNIQIVGKRGSESYQLVEAIVNYYNSLKVHDSIVVVSPTLGFQRIFEKK